MNNALDRKIEFLTKAVKHLLKTVEVQGQMIEVMADAMEDNGMLPDEKEIN